MPDATRILGIDPGLQLTGYGVVVLDEGPGLAEPRLVEGGVIRLKPKTSVEHRLVELHRELLELIDEHQPNVLAIEKLYAHYKHPRTAIVMAHARGVILLAAKLRAVEIAHLPSTEVKKAVTGHGHASKQQVQRAVQSQYRLAEPPTPFDVADAIAIATCHARRMAVERL
ncbi:crossover junction endodeoxyribonuclease RuvC [Phycisphaerales bacterium AB-hyl4]|uniref:Crossover junction endodeoxyribonuclease RuvC n=1 Tax=Natronomicrosphaera hydrolytica TaxID=3242702 RepID=A0ABV4U9A0_9BACT